VLDLRRSRRARQRRDEARLGGLGLRQQRSRSRSRASSAATAGSIQIRLSGPARRFPNAGHSEYSRDSLNVGFTVLQLPPPRGRNNAGLHRTCSGRAGDHRDTRTSDSARA
jgi:hypothetical protein